jgi:hypothetical protein
VSNQSRKTLVLLFVGPLCLFVAGYCYAAAMSSGGWHLTRDGEPSFTKPSHYSKDFYEGLRWSVMTVGILMAALAQQSKERGASMLYWAVAALFNPIFPVHLDKGLWQFIDSVVGLIFLSAPSVVWPKDDPLLKNAEGEK